jgi:hypothetical protein
MKTRKEIAKLAAVLAVRCGNLALVADDTMLLARIGAAAETKAEQLCNDEIEQWKFDLAQYRLCVRLKPLVGRYAVRFEIGGDPRGYVLKMFSNDARPIGGNTLGGDEGGYGI